MVKFVPCLAGLLWTSGWHHRLFPSFPHGGGSVGELSRISTLCLTADGSSRKFRLGSDFEIPVWRYPVGVNQGPVPVSRSFFLLLVLVYIFSVLYWCIRESTRAGQWSKTCILFLSCNLPSNNKSLLYVKLFLWA
jgi:hypothetical protein